MATVIELGEPPAPPIDMPYGGPDKCAQCPVRTAMAQRQAEKAALQDAQPYILKMGHMGVGVVLFATAPDDTYVFSVLAATYLSDCPGPQTERRWRIPTLGGGCWRFGRTILRCTNSSVPEVERRLYYSDV